MEIKIKKSVQVEETIEVTFPLFFKSDYTVYAFYSEKESQRIFSLDGIRSVSNNGDSLERFYNSSDYKKSTPISKQEFAEILTEALEVLTIPLLPSLAIAS